jgi:SAM-dependent methyltransferase
MSDNDGKESAAEFWDERYRSTARAWSGEPNPYLVSEISSLTPGADQVPATALEVGAGEGADAIWLARRGWDVTATDISAVALDRGLAQAATLEPTVASRITWRRADLLADPPPPHTFGLVTAHYLHLPKHERDPLFTALARAVAVGGTLLIVGHHPSDLQTSVPRPARPELFYSADDVAALLESPTLADTEWDVQVSESRPKPAVDPQGHDVTVHDTILRARRLR